MSFGHPDLDDLETEETESERREEEIESLRAAFNGCFRTPHGETVLAKLYDYCYYGRPTFVAGQPDKTANNEGKRAVLLLVMGYLQMDDEEAFRIARRVIRGR